MNLQMSPLALGSIVAFILAGCASTAIHEQELREPAASEGIVIGSLLVRGGRDLLGRTEWGLAIDRAETKFAPLPQYSIRAHQGREEVAFAIAMPSGQYRIRQLFQGGFSSFARNTDFSFEVQPGKTSYIGRLIVEFPDETITIATPVRIRVEDARDANIAAAEVKFRRKFTDVDTRLVVAGSTRSTLSVPPPPSGPLPISAFAVKFTPAGSLTYPPTNATGIKTYKVVLYLFDDPPKVRRDEKPTRPYVVIGKLQFGENWYTSENLTELEEKHVPQIGGDAVLTWSNHQMGAAVIPGVGTLSYGAHEAEVIRYTDK